MHSNRIQLIFVFVDEQEEIPPIGCMNDVVGYKDHAERSGFVDHGRQQQEPFCDFPSS